MSNTNDTKTPGDATVLAKFFGMKGAEAIREMRELTPEDKAQIADGIRDGSLTY